MKRKKTAYTCGHCGCRILTHKVKWKDGVPYCKSCFRYIGKSGIDPLQGNNEYWMKIFRKEQQKALLNS